MSGAGWWHTDVCSTFLNNESESDNESDNYDDDRQEMWENSEELWSLVACAAIKGCGSYYVQFAIIDQSEHFVGDYWPITAQDAHKWSVTASFQFLKTAPSPPGLWLVNIDHVTPLLASDWLIILTLLSRLSLSHSIQSTFSLSHELLHRRQDPTLSLSMGSLSELSWEGTCDVLILIKAGISI